MHYSVSFHAAVTRLGKTQGEAHPLAETPAERGLGDNLLGEQPQWGGGIARSGIGDLGSATSSEAHGCVLKDERGHHGTCLPGSQHSL